MMVVSNWVRIATLMLLANYADPEFFYWKLHHEVGVAFSGSAWDYCCRSIGC
jgi:exosortase/archaeosortase family protein